ncbi:MAG: cell shape determination protein CcmA [Gammaproteobacteria bacterium]|nr:MAG: cell shape determination protein CcmA [Pseudomonadota bacterium]PIE38585.1 MAG: cell shape determination protein CcmA [Gammaproteobacteria bacterium]
MWKRKTNGKISPNRYDTLISNTTNVMGDICFSGGLHIDGKVKGAIKAAGENGEAIVRISDVGEVDGDVVAPHVIVNGTVHGDVYATKHIELASEASINGNVYYHLIEMAMGAEVNGKLVHHKDSSAPVFEEGDPSERSQTMEEERSEVVNGTDPGKTKMQEAKESPSGVARPDADTDTSEETHAGQQVK